MNIPKPISEIPKMSPNDFVLFDAIYQPLDDNMPEMKSMVVLRKELSSAKKKEKLYEALLNIPYDEDTAAYRISEINYHFGYQIMGTNENKWVWNFCIFVDEDLELKISATYFSHDTGECDTEDQALEAVHKLIHKYTKDIHPKNDMTEEKIDSNGQT